jgi:hypothetical protein
MRVDGVEKNHRTRSEVRRMIHVDAKLSSSQPQSATPSQPADTASSVYMSADQDNTEITRILQVLSELPDVWLDVADHQQEDLLLNLDNYCVTRTNICQSLDVKVLDMSEIPFVSLRCVIEIPAGSDLTSVNLTRSCPSVTDNVIGEFSLPRGTDIVKIVTRASRYADFVSLTEFNSQNHFRPSASLHFRDLDDDEWKHLYLAIQTSKPFVDISNMTEREHETRGLGDERNREGYERLSLYRKVEDQTKKIAAVFETLDPFFQSLPGIDKMILLKEATSEVLIIRSWLTYDRETDAVMSTGLGDRLTIGVKIRRYKEESRAFYRGLKSLLTDWIDDAVRQDHVVMNMTLFLCLYQDRQGLFSTEAIIHERRIYQSILKKYVEAKWSAMSTEILEQLDTKLRQVTDVKRFCENMSLVALCASTNDARHDHDVASPGSSLFDVNDRLCLQ